MKPGGRSLIREDQKALLMRIHMNIVTVTGLAQVEEVLDMIKKDIMLIIREALAALQ